MKGFRLRNIVALFALVLMGASILMAHVWKQNAYVRLSKESAQLNRDGKALRDSIALLEMEAGALRKLARIEGLAKARFGLEYGNNPVLVYPEEGADGREAMMARSMDGERARAASAGESPSRGFGP